jgi:hypothetical protein
MKSISNLHRLVFLRTIVFCKFQKMKLLCIENKDGRIKQPIIIKSLFLNKILLFNNLVLCDSLMEFPK